MTVLTLPEGSAPSNLRLRPSVQTRFVDSDMYNICERIKEIDPNLYIIDLEEDDDHCYAIMETAKDGTEMLVMKVKELDERVLHRLRYLAAVPLSHRIKLWEIEAKKNRQRFEENELDELYERMGRPMWTQLEHDGFIQRGVSYPKKGVAQAKRLALG